MIFSPSDLVISFPFGITSFTYQEILQGAKSEQELDRLQAYLSTQRFYHPKDPLESFEAAARIYFSITADK